MALRKATDVDVTRAEAPQPEPGAPPARDRSVKGQVAMHAIETGYHVAARLAPTIAAKPEQVIETLHKLAEEVAARIEAYTFRD